MSHNIAVEMDFGWHTDAFEIVEYYRNIRQFDIFNDEHSHNNSQSKTNAKSLLKKKIDVGNKMKRS